jgi:hypothetical protein
VRDSTYLIEAIAKSAYLQSQGLQNEAEVHVFRTKRGIPMRTFGTLTDLTVGSLTFFGLGFSGSSSGSGSYDGGKIRKYTSSDNGNGEVEVIYKKKNEYNVTDKPSFTFSSSFSSSSTNNWNVMGTCTHK